MRSFLVIFFCLFINQSFSKQIKELQALPLNEQPASLQFKSLLSPVATVNLPDLAIDKLAQQADMQKPGTGPYQFATAVTNKAIWANLTDWEQLGDTWVYKIRFVTNGVSINVGLVDVFLPSGAKIFFYTPDGKKITSFDEADNQPHGELWTPVFESKELVMEVNAPDDVVDFTRFSIQQVAQGFRSIEPSMLRSGNCNINVVCSQGDDWRDEIRSVARIVISGTGLCTGTLVNNVEQNNRPFFLSASHCGIDSSTAPSIVFYWNFEASQCNMTTPQADGALNQFQTGSTFRANHPASDLALVELSSTPEPSFNVYYAGWNNSTSAPSSAVAIHHPSGDEKRISFDNDALTIVETIGSTVANSNGTHLLVGAWDLGTTEGGSSGSAIWDANKYIVGTLHGGIASCTQPDQPDWYGRLASQWNGGGSTSTQLKAWLDPNNTNAVTLAGMEACSAPTVQLQVSPSNTTIGESISFNATASGGSGEGYTYQWDFNQDLNYDASGSSTTYTYTQAFTGNVSVTVSDSTGCLTRKSAAVVVQSSGGGSSGGGAINFWVIILLLGYRHFRVKQ